MVGLSNGASIILFGRNLHSPLPLQSLPYAFYYRYALCPLLFALFRKLAEDAWVFPRGVGSTLRGVVPYGMESSRRPNWPRFNILRLQSQADCFPVWTKYFWDD